MRRNLTLSELCDYLTSGHYELLPENHPMGMRLVCPEYSRSAQEVTSYPFLSRDRIFAICWRFDEAQNLYATMYPSLNPFIYHRPSGGCMQTQLHTHDYMELGYVVRGEFHQKILGKDTIFTEGDLFLIDRNCIHQDSLTALSTVILFLGIAGDMFTEIKGSAAISALSPEYRKVQAGKLSGRPSHRTGRKHAGNAVYPKRTSDTVFPHYQHRIRLYPVKRTAKDHELAYFRGDIPVYSSALFHRDDTGAFRCFSLS